ncbi:hypothetical protein [Paraburkholderia sp. RL17-337-BIB-A]|uniref:hypothetical protein n=1 Tax=Paraburkholderia sp. RL17-337-BIB-A TaxID=3031636 RepID=UPI0038BDDC00
MDIASPCCRLTGVVIGLKLIFRKNVSVSSAMWPDPALQPIVPLGAKMLAIPCIHFLSSHAERNVLSLMARTETVQFNSQSSLFEKGVVGRLAATASVPANCAMLVNRTFRGGGKEEEIDVLLIDEVSHHILVCELRRILPPADPKEVRSRKSECLKKVRQLRRKKKVRLGRKQLGRYCAEGAWMRASS